MGTAQLIMGTEKMQGFKVNVFTEGVVRKGKMKCCGCKVKVFCRLLFERHAVF